MNKSSLYERQKSSGAELDSFYGYPLPGSHGNVAAEYTAVKKQIAIMHCPYLSMLKISGPDHLDLLHRMTTNEVRHLKSGEGQINLFTNEKGRLIDRVLLHKEPDFVRLFTSPAHADQVKAWIEKFIFIENVKVEDLTPQFESIKLLGPQGPLFLSQLFASDFNALPQACFKTVTFFNEELLFTRLDNLRIPAFSVVVKKEIIPRLWDFFLEHGQKTELKPLGETVHEILRIEAGWPILNKDFDDQVNPHEARMLTYVDFNKGCYIGQEVIARLDTYEKVKKYLMGVIWDGDSVPKSQTPICHGDEEIGHLTSAAFSPARQKTVALGYISSKFLETEGDVQIKTDDQLITGRLIKPPIV
ncbi:MAG: glycine cleavage T C-terminal barrel domain-containing protein [bacterium]